jgi:tRNA G10  N-methylase Trm11
MIVGMLPPKLARMMINLTKNNTAIYDPFCGLGTVLIEALHMGRIHILASDISEAMVSATEKNTHEFIETEKIWHERIRAK